MVIEDAVSVVLIFFLLFFFVGASELLTRWPSILSEISSSISPIDIIQ